MTQAPAGHHNKPEALYLSFRNFVPRVWWQRCLQNYQAQGQEERSGPDVSWVLSLSSELLHPGVPELVPRRCRLNLEQDLPQSAAPRRG